MRLFWKKKKIPDRSAQYICELFEDDKRNFIGLPTMKDEIRAAITKMKLGKAKGPDSELVEFLQALEDYGIDKIKKCDTGHIPPGVSKSIFIAQPKKPKATKCELYRKSSLVSRITKILLRIISRMQTRNSRGTVSLWREKIQHMQSTSHEL